jgi:hypothetical protein
MASVSPLFGSVYRVQMDRQPGSASYHKPVTLTREKIEDLVQAGRYDVIQSQQEDCTPTENDQAAFHELAKRLMARPNGQAYAFPQLLTQPMDPPFWIAVDDAQGNHATQYRDAKNRDRLANSPWSQHFQSVLASLTRQAEQLGQLFISEDGQTRLILDADLRAKEQEAHRLWEAAMTQAMDRNIQDCLTRWSARPIATLTVLYTLKEAAGLRPPGRETPIQVELDDRVIP